MRCPYTIAILFCSGCWYTPNTPDLEQPPRDLVDVPFTPGGNCRPEDIADVACVLDGDTFDVRQCGDSIAGERIRMLGIQAPEIAHEDNPAECYGYEATNALEEFIDGKEVLLSFDQECVGVFGRTLAYVWLPLSEADGEDTVDLEFDGVEYLLVNTWMLNRGYARGIPEEQFGTLLLQDRFNAAEAYAQSRSLGLWGACDP